MRKLDKQEQLNTIEMLKSGFDEFVASLETDASDEDTRYFALRELANLAIILATGSAPEKIREIAKEENVHAMRALWAYPHRPQ